MHDWCLEVWGDFACFTRPELKVERVSYDVMTPSAARGILEAIFWKPAIRWNITSIEILNPINFTSIRRNEVGKTISIPTAKQMRGEENPPNGIYIEEQRQQRSGLILKDVRYRIHAYFDFLGSEENKMNGERKSQDETEMKYAAMFERRAKKGQCFTRPYLGTREFACDFRLVNPERDTVNPIDDNRDLGFMLYDLDFEKNAESPQPLFFRANMIKGVVNTDRRKIKVIG